MPTLSPTDLIEKLTAAAAKVVSPDEAAYFAAEAVETHIRKCNVSNPLKSTIGDLEACLKHADIEIAEDFLKRLEALA